MRRLANGRSHSAISSAFLLSERAEYLSLDLFPATVATVLRLLSIFFWTPMPADIGTLQLLVFFTLLCLLCGALALIDIRRGIIPNRLNLAIAALGLLKAIIAGGVMAGIEAGGEGVAIGAIFWLLRRFYFALRKTQGLGLGDVKFLAATGPWIGIAGLPALLLIATLAALAAAGGLQLAGRNITRQSSLPFGPFLALGLLLTVVLQQFLDL
jgi:leader peptidase (prepilin peptidase) / N-methyltransferase